MSHTLTRLSSGERAPQSGSSIPEEKNRISLQTHLSKLPSIFFSAKEARSTAALFSLFGCCYKRLVYYWDHKHFESIAHSFSGRGKLRQNLWKNQTSWFGFWLGSITSRCSSPVPKLPFLSVPYRGWTRAGERRVLDNLHAHAQNEPIKNIIKNY